MIQDYKPGGYETITNYELVFDDGSGNGYSFPCDANGCLLPDVPEMACKNHAWCMEQPDLFERWNKVVTRSHRYCANATGVCACGTRIELWDEYMGACQCPKCESWYNLFGQELLPPSQWENDDYEPFDL